MLKLFGVTGHDTSKTHIPDLMHSECTETVKIQRVTQRENTDETQMELLCIARGPAGTSEGCDRYCSREHLAGLLGGAKKRPRLSSLSQCSGHASLRLVLLFLSCGVSVTVLIDHLITHHLC